MDSGGGGGDCYGALCELVSQCDRMCTELRRHQRSASDADRRKSEWRSVALVLDRLLLVAGCTISQSINQSIIGGGRGIKHVMFS